MCAWTVLAITIDFLGNESIRLSSGTDNLERADLKINLKSLYIICKKLLSISYQHNAAPVCGQSQKLLTACGDILSQSTLPAGILDSGLSKVKTTLLTAFVPVVKPSKTFSQSLIPSHNSIMPRVSKMLANVHETMPVTRKRRKPGDLISTRCRSLA